MYEALYPGKVWLDTEGTNGIWNNDRRKEKW